MHDTNITPRIYVACLASYNAGKLHGRWIDATIGADLIEHEIGEMLAESPEPGAEEFAIHDHEGLEAIDAAGDNAPALLAWLDAEPGRDPGEFDDRFRGEWRSLAEYVEDYWESVGHDGEKSAGGSWWHPARYVDWEAMARDLRAAGDVETIDATAGVYVFDAT
jgi:antirestriction protein